jgi:hypothetical protein
LSTNQPYKRDNYCFEVAYQFGVLSLWFFLLLVLTLFQTFNALGNGLSGVDAAFADGVGALVLAAMAASMVATFFELLPHDLFFWLLVGVTASMDANAQSAVPARARPALTRAGT